MELAVGDDRPSPPGGKDGVIAVTPANAGSGNGQAKQGEITQQDTHVDQHPPVAEASAATAAPPPQAANASPKKSSSIKVRAGWEGGRRATVKTISSITFSNDR